MFPINDDAPQINGRPFINYGLIAINVIIFIYEMIITSNFSNRFAQFMLFTNYGAIPNLILSGQNLPSLFTSMFMHGSIAHIIGNMIFLYVFGDNLEGRFGHYKYLALYLIWGIIASFAHSFYAVFTGGGNVPAIGASGAISGVLAAYLVFFPHAKINTIVLAFFITTIRIPALAFIPFWFIMQLIFALIGQSGGVAYVAHVGGFLAGVGTAYLWKFISNSYNRRPFVATKTTKIDRSQSLQSPILEKDIQPEVILGNSFFDIIIHAGGIIEESDIKTEYNNSTKILFVKIPNYNKSYSISIPNSNNFALDVSSISVNNGIIKIRLALSS
jgi:membrane associated rhomboid family serine protease